MSGTERMHMDYGLLMRVVYIEFVRGDHVTDTLRKRSQIMIKVNSVNYMKWCLLRRS